MHACMHATENNR